MRAFFNPLATTALALWSNAALRTGLVRPTTSADSGKCQTNDWTSDARYGSRRMQRFSTGCRMRLQGRSSHRLRHEFD